MEVLTIIKLDAKVNGKHYIGDQLTDKDFTVKVTYNDGTVVKNPLGWTFSPTTLVQETNILTVTYKNVVTKIVFVAKQK